MASSSSNQISSSSLWDVFCSFRGIDTRYTFTSHLYNALHRFGIRIYMDDPELRSGQVISDSLIQAIHESKTCIVVFSENYASSPWCLDELVEIYDCYTSVGGLVIPVFYKIDPSVVRHQTGSFKEAFEKHETRFKGEMEKLNKWRDALNKVAGFSGKHIDAQRSEAGIINEIVDEILLEINPKTLHVARYPVGLASRVEDIKTLLISDTESVRRIGIHGMGGVGKTTLAKAVYNNIYHCFRGSCFLANVRETSVTERGQICLQEQLINDVLRCKNTIITNVDQGIELIRARICSIKVLIVIDDLDDSTVLEYIGGPFALGSLIIITTRKEDLLESIKVDAKYKLNELSDHESRQLFSQHAFGVDKIPEEFMKLSEEIVRYAGGLPLALVVFGSDLYRRSDVGWKSFIWKLQHVPNSTIQQRLIISLDALESDDPMLKQIFIDIACFFIGYTKQEAVKILDTYYSNAEHNIDILIKRCLLTVDNYDQLGMHVLLRDLGRNIARNNSFDEPGEHSTLWVAKDIYDVLEKHKGTEAIEAIIPNRGYSDGPSTLSTETFKMMRKLRFLDRIELIGAGSYGNIYKVIHRPSGKLYALKVINFNHGESLDGQIRWYIENLFDLDNVNLVKCHHILEEDNEGEIQVVLEYMDKGSLKGFHIIHEPALAELTRQVLSGIHYLHHKKMAHQDIMPSKLLFNSRNQVKINVFGVSKRDQSTGMASYMSPEKINRDLDHYDRCAADIWSLGVTILELYMGCSPFVGDSLPPQAPPTASPEFREFISLCLQKDPAKRWNADQLLSHPFVTQILLPSSGYNNKTVLSSVLNSPPFGGCNVFLSFSGVDTRYNFTSHLYSALVHHGVPTFMDDTEMERGPGILDVSTQAIQNSKIYVVVFSKNYAASPRCLDQLVEILQCSNSMGRLVLPIYYNIEPSVVWTQSGSFNEAFEQHENHFDVNRLDKWRIALMNVWILSRHILLYNMSEVDIINQVVDRAVLELNPMSLAVARYPVGLGSRVKDVTALFRSDAEGVSRTSIHDVGGAGKAITTKRIGIHGMGGVGKTTLAKAVYNQHYHQFQGSSFLANIREVSGTETGLISLQQKLINDVLKCKNINIANVDQGIELIRARICSMKILIVFDDMDDPMPLEFLGGPFAFGSIILITTRNEDLLDSIKIEARYKVNELGDAESRQLFSQHAFGEDKISPEFTELSQIILQRAGGLPLALEVFGSNLFDQSEEGKICIDKMNQVSINDVEKKLMISYDALELVDPMLQDIFLDIACFFIGQKKEEVVKKIETCYSYADYNIEVLKKRCLVTFNDKDKLGMHDLFRDMGRKIACNNSPDEPGKHSRLWVATDIYEVLKDHKGTESIECIIPWNFDYQNALERVSFSTETFKMMCNLRFLQLEGYLTGSFEQLFEDLRWLRWDRCPLTCLPSEFYPEKLVILELPGSKIRKMFKLSMVSQVFENLKTLNLSYSLDLRTLPDFNMFPFLETINLEGCKSLREVHISIGILARLVSLNMHDCVELKGLPDTICNLRALEVLNINGCINLKALPVELGNIESLKVFDAEKLSVSRLPDSIGCLSKLVQLNLSCNHMNRLPHLSKMKGLEELKLTNCSSLKEIQGLEDLTSIRKLHLGGCSSSLLAYTFTERFFQIYSTFGHQINIYAPSSEFPDWTGQSDISGLTLSSNLSPNMSHNFLATIFCFERGLDLETLYEISVKNTNSDSVRNINFYADNYESCIVILPRSVILVRDGDDRIEFTTRQGILRIHLLYKSEIQ